MAEFAAADALAPACVLLAVLLLGRRPFGSRYGAFGASRLANGRRALWLIALPGGALAVAVPSGGLLAGVGVGAAAGAWWLISKRRAQLRVRQTSQAVQTACADLADDLRMGRVPHEALIAAARRWPPLQPVAVAAELHHDVDRALLHAALMPGAEGLRHVAAAWQVSTQVGSGLASALSQVALLLASNERRARLVEAELAAARATAAIVSGLPILVLGMGAGLGSNPWSFFLSGVGVVVLALAVVLLFAGWAWIDVLAAKATRAL